MDPQKTTSKTQTLNLMLMKAFRERWTEYQWGLQIKTVLPRGVSGDVYNLADCILQQAIGVGANQLLLSYLKHSLCSHLISHAAVLKRFSKYSNYDKYHCLIALLDFLDSIIDGVTCRSKPEEGVLKSAILSLVNWLLEIFEAITLKIVQTNGNSIPEQDFCIKKVSVLLGKIVANNFLLGVLYLSKFEEQETFAKMSKSYFSMKAVLAESSNLLSQDLVDQTTKIMDALNQITFLKIEHLKMIEFESNEVENVTYCLQPLLAVEVLLNPSTDTHLYVQELLMIQRLKGFSMARLYSEVIRACLISLNNVNGTARDSIWSAFTFIKVPHILKQLHMQTSNYDDKMDFSEDIVHAVELLLENSPILDFMDTKCACNTIEALLNELKKQRLVNDKYIVYFSAKREAITSNLQKLEINISQPSIVKFVMRAEPPLLGILKTLSHDYNKVQEALLCMLCQVLSGNSFELILSVATVDRKLKTFVQRLIKCNECSKQVPGEVGNAALIRSSLFDVSFLMLFFIVQTYGSEVVLDETGGDSFFEKYVQNCMVERNVAKSPMSMVRACDPAKVDELLVYFNSPENPLQSKPASISMKWHEICMNIPGMLYQVVLAWENESLTAVDVKGILDNLRSKLCCYSVVSASWLCAYMQIVKEDELLKPKNMVHQLTTLSQEDIQTKQETFKERLGLTVQIIRKMMRAPMQTNNLVSQVPLEELFDEQWTQITDRYWLPVECTQTLESLLQACGPFWLVNKLYMKLSQCKRLKEMQKTMDIVFALMHLDLEACTIALLSELLPILLLTNMQTQLIEPNSRILAKLCVYLILATMEAPGGSSKKRSRVEDEDGSSPLPKIRKLTDQQNVGSGSQGSGGDSNDGNLPAIREPLQQCLQNLFKMFHQQVTTDELSTKINFIYQFLSLLVQCGTSERIKPILKLIPSGLVQNMLKVVPNISAGFILRLYDLGSTYGRLSGMSDLCLLKSIEIRKNSIQL